MAVYHVLTVAMKAINEPCPETTALLVRLEAAARLEWPGYVTACTRIEINEGT